MRYKCKPGLSGDRRREVDVDKEKLKELLAGAAKDGKIACAQALKISQEQGVATREVGRILDELKIKIAGCQLGCF